MYYKFPLLVFCLIFMASCVSKKKYTILSQSYAQTQRDLEKVKAHSIGLAMKLKDAKNAKKMALSEKNAIAYSLRKRIKVLESKVIVLKQSKKRYTPTQRQIRKKQRSSY